MIVLDTHAAVFWTTTPELLGSDAAAAILKADRLGIPAIVFWEVALLVRKKRLALDLPVKTWAERVCAIPRVVPIPLTPEIAVHADSLAMHADPADRFVVASALAHRCTVVTRDEGIRDTGLVKTIW